MGRGCVGYRVPPMKKADHVVRGEDGWRPRAAGLFLFFNGSDKLQVASLKV